MEVNTNVVVTHATMSGTASPTELMTKPPDGVLPIRGGMDDVVDEASTLGEEFEVMLKDGTGEELTATDVSSNSLVVWGIGPRVVSIDETWIAGGLVGAKLVESRAGEIDGSVMRLMDSISVNPPVVERPSVMVPPSSVVGLDASTPAAEVTS
jgi:hypothetical protein